jgi:hypothetical protein
MHAYTCAYQATHTSIHGSRYFTHNRASTRACTCIHMQERHVHRQIVSTYAYAYTYMSRTYMHKHIHAHNNSYNTHTHKLYMHMHTHMQIRIHMHAHTNTYMHIIHIQTLMHYMGIGHIHVRRAYTYMHYTHLHVLDGHRTHTCHAHICIHAHNTFIHTFMC